MPLAQLEIRRQSSQNPLKIHYSSRLGLFNLPHFGGNILSLQFNVDFDIWGYIT